MDTSQLGSPPVWNLWSWLLSTHYHTASASENSFPNVCDNLTKTQQSTTGRWRSEVETGFFAVVVVFCPPVTKVLGVWGMEFQRHWTLICCPIQASILLLRPVNSISLLSRSLVLLSSGRHRRPGADWILLFDFCSSVPIGPLPFAKSKLKPKSSCSWCLGTSLLHRSIILIDFDCLGACLVSQWSGDRVSFKGCDNRIPPQDHRGHGHPLPPLNSCRKRHFTYSLKYHCVMSSVGDTLKH